MPSTTSNFARESGDTRSPMAAALAFDEKQKHLVGDAGASVSLSSGTVVDLTWPLVCVRCEAAVCYSDRLVPHEFDRTRQEKL